MKKVLERLIREEGFEESLMLQYILSKFILYLVILYIEVVFFWPIYWQEHTCLCNLTLTSYQFFSLAVLHHMVLSSIKTIVTWAPDLYSHMFYIQTQEIIQIVAERHTRFIAKAMQSIPYRAFPCVLCMLTQITRATDLPVKKTVSV